MAIDWSDNIVIAQLTDEPALSDELSLVIERISNAPRGEVPHAVLDFSAVTYVNSSNIAQILRLRKVLDEAGREVKLCAVSDEVWSVMMVTGLDKVLRFSPDIMTALAGLQLEDERRDR